jgi:hypothetical protein
MPSFSYESEGIGTKTCRDGWNHYYKMWVQFINPDSLHQSKNSSRYLVFCTCLISQIIIMLIYSISWSWSCSGAPSSSKSSSDAGENDPNKLWRSSTHFNHISASGARTPKEVRNVVFAFSPNLEWLWWL